MSLEVPKPVLPQLEGLGEYDESAEPEETEEDMFREKLYQNVANLIGFVSAIGLPKKLFLERHKYYAELAMETGVSESLIETIEYYFPDIEFSPALMLLLALAAYAPLVITDRLKLQEEIEKHKKRKKAEKHTEEIKEEKRKAPEKVKVLNAT